MQQIALALDYDPDDADAPRPPPPPLRRWWDPLIGCEVATLTIKHQKKRGPKGPRKRPPPAPPPANDTQETTMPETQNDNQPNLPLVTYRREIRVKLTDSDLARYGRQLSHTVRDKSLLDEKRKAVAAEYNAQLKDLEAKISRLSDAMQNSEELRDLEVYDRYHAGVIEIRRADNDEVVDTRPATVADRDVTGADNGFPAIDDEATGEPGDGAGEGEPEPETPEEDFGGAVARGAGKSKKAPKVDLVTSSVGDTVATMPDDEDGDEPWPAEDPAKQPVEPEPKKGKGKGAKKVGRK